MNRLSAHTALKVPVSHSAAPAVDWLNLDTCAALIITARGERLARARSLWSASCPGEQMIEIRFHHPTAVRRLRVVTTEAEQARTQEMTVWVSLHRGERHHHVLCQHFDFSPDGATEDVEEYALELEGVSAIQLRIVPSVDGRPATARVRELRVASV